MVKWKLTLSSELQWLGPLTPFGVVCACNYQKIPSATVACLKHHRFCLDAYPVGY
jgi:hypothetical protein